MLRPQTDRFGLLVRSVISQQISKQAAISIDGRLRALTGKPHEPSVLVTLTETELRSVGLSGVKARYVMNLAAAVHSGSVPLQKFGRWGDEAIMESLTSIKGIGVWTAEMFLIFALNRPDVLPVGDLGVRRGIRFRFGLTEMPSPKKCHQLAETWRPYRTIASWYLWREKGTPAEAKPA
jgi:DNA-3-methyladenine glycosylase II